MMTTIVVAFVALILIQVVLISRLSEHRTDIGRGENPGTGPSWSWEVNMFAHAKYDERGQRLKRWILVLAAIQLALIATWVIRQP